MGEYPLEATTPCPAQAGDALFFSYPTIHGSGINEGAEARTTLLVQMRDSEDTPSVNTHNSRPKHDAARHRPDQPQQKLEDGLVFGCRRADIR